MEEGCSCLFFEIIDQSISCYVDNWFDEVIWEKYLVIGVVTGQLLELGIIITIASNPAL